MLWYGSDYAACSLGVLDVVILCCIFLRYGMSLDKWVLGDVWLLISCGLCGSCRCGIFLLCLCVLFCDVQYIHCVFYGSVVMVFLQFVLGVVCFLFPLKGVCLCLFLA